MVLLWDWSKIATDHVERVWILCLGDIQNPTGHGPEQCALLIQLWAEELDLQIYTGTFKINNFDTENCAFNVEEKIKENRAN